MLAAKKRPITYSPPAPALLAAIREELRRLVDLPDLDANLGAISRFASQADDLLAVVKAPEAILRDENEVNLPGVAFGPTNAETYGATMIRTIMVAAEKWHERQTQSPIDLIAGLALARRSGMTDVARELEMKLLGKPLDGERPIDPPPEAP